MTNITPATARKLAKEYRSSMSREVLHAWATDVIEALHSLADQLAKQTTSERQFPVLQGKKLRSVPWSMLVPHERQAIANHSQDLETLARRGGLSPVEMAAVILGKPFREVQSLSEELAEHTISKMAQAHLAAASVPTPSDADVMFRILFVGDKRVLSEAEAMDGGVDQ